MMTFEPLKNLWMLNRRSFLRTIVSFAGMFTFYHRGASGQSRSAGLPLPDEPVDATLKRLFGNRSLNPGAGKLKLELPLIAEDGSNVAVAVESNLPMSGVGYLNHISDKNRRPMIAKFIFTPESGQAFVSTQIRLATTTDVRAVAEMSDGTLYAVTKHVRVTISGCDLPPQS
jgi:sulfur-oxidizing protein SoxY